MLNANTVDAAVQNDRDKNIIKALNIYSKSRPGVNGKTRIGKKHDCNTSCVQLHFSFSVFLTENDSEHICVDGVCDRVNYLNHIKCLYHTGPIYVCKKVI
jgi:hypothetical protein